MKDENKLNVRMLSDVCMQSRLLKEALESKLPLALEITPFSELWLEENKPESRSIQMLVIDYSRISDDVLTDYSSFKHISCPDAKEVIINCPQDIEHKLLFKWNNLAGVFYIDDDMDTLIKGMSKILQDEMWLTRKLAQEYILHYRAGKLSRDLTNVRKINQKRTTDYQVTW
ncbi:transcriptional regulator [Vibrio cholerae MAK 757]|nr:transcriptional regulator [Vibrio cholerae MAK 757]